MKKPRITLPHGFFRCSSHVSATKTNWKTVAEAITHGKTTKFDQAYAIYRWLCDNIAYDTTYTIRTADEAYRKRSGVCQAYSELFYRLGEAIGLTVDIVVGKSKYSDGQLADGAHAWVFVHTDGNTGILADATWGAGNVKNGVFTRTPGDDSWFNVDPNWMIFTHFPQREDYRFLPVKIDLPKFKSLPGLYPSLALFGFKGQNLLQKALAGTTLDLPKCYPVDFVTGMRIPQEGTLRVGRVYDFTVRFNGSNRFAVIHEHIFHKDWTVRGDLAFARFIPSTGGTLKIAYEMPAGNLWMPVVSYKVAPPTPDDLSRLDQARKKL